jgi:hypothetical protein
MVYVKKGKKYLRSTTDLKTTKEKSDFTEWIRNHAGMNGIYIPSPDDYNRNWVEIERTIEANRNYL